MEHETLVSLLCSWPHWLFELLLMVIFDFLIGVLLWPRIRRAFKHHESDDDKIEDLRKRVSLLEKNR
jgi:hypothetical protein